MKDFSKQAYLNEINQIYFKNGGSVKITNQQQKDAYINANTIDLDPNTPIFRIFKIENLISTLKDKKLCLVKPRLWDDPFENFLFNAEGILKDGTHVSFEPIREQFYGQCWSLKEECDGLWRNYTSNSCKKCTDNDYNKRHGHTPISVKVKTTVGKLMDAFYDETNPFHSLCYFIGKVRYCKISDIVDYLKDANNITDTTNINQVLSLLIKRKAFSYEEEVRLVFSRPSPESEIDLSSIKNPWNHNSDTFKFTIDPDQLFDEIELNPWIDNCDSIISDIKKYYKGNVVKSKLYDHPFFTLKL